jgi:hypothetical protein
MSKKVDKVLEENEKTDEEVQRSLEQADAAPDADDDMLVFPLSKPIKAYGDKITVIKMRRPEGMDLVIVGNPVIYYPHVEPARVEHDFEKVVKMVARLSEPKIPSQSIATLDQKDLVGLAWVISPFFIPAR